MKYEYCGLFPRGWGNRQGREFHCTHRHRAEALNMWSITSMPLHSFIAWYLVTGTTLIFTFTLRFIFLSIIY